jgi:hypothetical protein
VKLVGGKQRGHPNEWPIFFCIILSFSFHGY